MRKLIGILLFFCMFSFLLGTDYYVKNGGNDSASGLDDDNAWETIERVNDESLSGDDVVYFKKGDTWRVPLDEALTPTDSGTSGHQITFGAYGSGNLPKILGSIEKNDTGDWTDEGGNLWYASSSSSVVNLFMDSDASIAWMVSAKGSLNAQGRAWYDSGNDRIYLYSTSNPATSYSGSIECSISATVCYINNQSYVTVEYIDFKYAGGHSVVRIRQDLSGSETGIIIDNCTAKYAGSNLDAARAFYLQRISGTTISNCTIGWSHGNVFLFADGESTQTATIDTNTITGVISDSPQNADAIQLYDADYNGTVISNNTITGWYDDAIDMVGGSNVIFESNICHSPRSSLSDGHGSENEGNGIKMALRNSNTGNIARYNKVYNLNNGYNCHGIILNGCNNAEVYYNIIYNVEGNGVLNNGRSATLKGDNNVFYNNAVSDVGNDACRIDGNYGAITNVVQNNIFDKGDGNDDLDTGSSDVTITGGYNCLRNDAAVAGSGSYSGSSDDLYNTNPQWIDSANGDFHLQPFSTCIEGGTDVGLTEDYDGTVVPQDTDEDIGAEEYEAGGNGGSEGAGNKPTFFGLNFLLCMINIF